jgi:phage repressor protein C with HTH and peptisase S24 domain
MNKSKMIQALVEHYCGGNKAQFANMLGIRPQTINSWIIRGTFDAELIYAKCEDVSADWLMSGSGEMIKNTSDDINTQDGNYNIEIKRQPKGGIPIIPFNAMAGYMSGSMSINEEECDRFFMSKIHADFVIQVSGDSMEPRYHSGDYVACEKASLSDHFFEWGRVYVLDTKKGVVIKKVRKGPSKDEVLLVSENKDYDPTLIPVSSIYHIALVKGVVRIE